MSPSGPFGLARARGRKLLARAVVVALVAAVLPLPLGGTALAAGASFTSYTCTDLTALPVSANTGEKPQSKVWQYGGAWWAVLPTSAVSPGPGTWLWRLDGTSWTSVLKLSDNTDTHADITTPPV